MDMLARREHSVKELLAKLCNKGYAQTTAGEAVAALVQEGLVSDERFTEMLLSARRGRGVGPLRIQRELEEKGVAQELIEQWLDVTGPEWIKEVRRVRHKKFGKEPPGNFADRARQARFLQYRGFSLDQIQRELKSDDVD